MENVATQDVVQALGLALSMVGAMMEGADVVPAGDFARKLALLAEITRETEPAQADILERWARVAAQACEPPSFAS